MNNFLVLTNETKDPEYAVAHKIQNYFEAHGATCVVMNRFTRNIQDEIKNINEDTQCIIVLGGDGTMLHAARLTVKYDLPIVGVNLGTLGFLTEIEVANLEEQLDRLLNDDFLVEERTMLEGRVYHKGEEKYHLPVLNDVVITRSGFSRIISLKILVNGKLLDLYQADGVIISTPTGSTGYSLSAGGSVVAPNAKVILVTPICPHSLQTKCMVLSEDDEIEVQIESLSENQLEEAYVTYDGQIAEKFQPGDILKVDTYPKKAKIIKVHEDSFYRTLRRKVGGAHEKE